MVFSGRTRTNVTLSFEDTTWMHAYVCEPHRRSTVGYFAFADD